MLVYSSKVPETVLVLSRRKYSGRLDPFAWGVDQSSYRTFALDRWTESNPSQNVLMPRLHKDNANNANNQVASTWWLRNGGFLQLKNMEFGYQLPKQFLKKFNVSGCQNLCNGI